MFLQVMIIETRVMIVWQPDGEDDLDLRREKRYTMSTNFYGLAYLLSLFGAEAVPLLPLQLGINHTPTPGWLSCCGVRSIHDIPGIMDQIEYIGILEEVMLSHAEDEVPLR